MHECISESEHKDFVRAFNLRPKDGIQSIRAKCETLGIESQFEEVVASFFIRYSRELDLEAVGDYLGTDSTENIKVLEKFTSSQNFSGKNMTDALREFLQTIKLPGEAQKIDRLVECFSKCYVENNPLSNFENSDSVYVLTFATIMLNTDLHNPSISPDRKMTLDGFKRNLQGANNGREYKPEILEAIYNDIKSNPFKFNFAKKQPGYVLNKQQLNKDDIFNKLDQFFSYSPPVISDVFSKLGSELSARVDKPKSWLNRVMGYRGTITLFNGTDDLTIIQVYKPNFFSRLLFEENPKVVIQPIHKVNQDTASIEVAAKVASSFMSSIDSIEATYDYLKEDLQIAYQKHSCLTIEPQIETQADLRTGKTP